MNACYYRMKESKENANAKEYKRNCELVVGQTTGYFCVCDLWRLFLAWMSKSFKISVIVTEDFVPTGYNMARGIVEHYDTSFSSPKVFFSSSQNREVP